MTVDGFERVRLDGAGIDRITEGEVVAVVREALASGRGGWIMTPNVDILRRSRRGAQYRQLLESADLVVADGMPLVWASRLGGQPVPERVAGSSLIWSLSAGLGHDRGSVFVIGGTPASRGVADGAARAAQRLAERSPGLRIAGARCPPLGFDEDPQACAELCAEVAATRPDLVFVGLGFPKQEALIARLRRYLPGAWFVGCGAAVNFVAGDLGRAPRWMQRTGLEWAHRLGAEPRRLAGRYLRHDAPYAMKLLAGAAARR